MFEFPEKIEVNGETWEKKNRFFDIERRDWGWIYSEKSGKFENMVIFERDIRQESDLRMEIWMRARLIK